MKERSQKENTWNFLQEYCLLEDIKNEDDIVEDIQPSEYDDDIRQQAEALTAPFDWNLNDGEIRLLSQTEKVTYAAILPWDNQHVLMVPFSHCENPATDLEMYSVESDRGLFLQVFQIWNARTVNRSLIAKSWLVDKVSQADLLHLNQMLKHYWQGEELSDEIRDLTAVPLLPENDMRHKFLDEEYENFAKLDAEDTAIEETFEVFENKNSFTLFRVIRPEVEQKLMAAAGKNKLSEMYLYSDSKLDFCGGIEISSFRKIPAGTSMPNFCWIAGSLPDGCNKDMKVIFRHNTEGITLGNGIIQQQDYGYEIIMTNFIESEDTPQIDTPADIQVILY